MTSCTVGYYCPDPWMEQLDTALECREGFYCSGGAYSMTPGNYIYYSSAGDDPTGDICRQGHYCPTRSSKQFSCPSTKFMPYEMAALDTDCIACPEGKYCDTSAMYDLSSKDCDAGYYCSGSSGSATQNRCDFN